MGTRTDVLGNLIIGDQSGDRPRVILLHADAAVRAEWARSLRSDCSLRAAADLVDVQTHINREHIDAVVVGEWHDGLLERLASSPRTRVVHCGKVVSESLVDAAEKGVELAHVDTVVDLGARILSMTHPRSQTERHAVAGLHVTWAGAESTHELAEISNDGLSFYVDRDQRLDPTLPGTILEEIEILRDGRVALSGATAAVRHVVVEQAQKGAPSDHSIRYRVGCEMRERPTPSAIEQKTFIRDRALSAGLVRTALRGGGVLVQGADAEGPGVFESRGQTDLSARVFVLPTLQHSFYDYDVVRCRFELGGSVYRFTSSVVARKPLTVRLPLTLEVSQSRGSGRYRPPITDPVVVDLMSPLLPGAMQREVHDISSSGFSFEIDPQIDLFPAGMVFSQIRIRLGDAEFHCRGQIRNLSRGGARHLGMRCGVQLEGLEESARLHLTDLIMRANYPGLEDGGALTFDQLWAFFLETRFVYPEKEKALAPIMPEIRHTIEALTARPSDLFKSVIAREGGKVIGHVSGLRAYQRTWMAQHLAAASGYHAGALLNMGNAEYFGQSVDLEFHKISFRPDNQWPARVFGGFARSVTDVRLSDLRTFDYYQLSVEHPLEPTPGIEVIEASGEDLTVVERHFVKTERGVLLRADDLTRDGLNLVDLNARYRRLGLQRRRRVLLALRRNEPVGFALVELSSPGLNFSELLSAFRIYLFSDEAAAPIEIRAALLRATLSLYKQAGRPKAVGLGLAAERNLYAQLGVVAGKQYCMWTCHRALYQRFNDHVDRLMRILAARAAQKTRNGPAGEKAR
jgi:hypothetical protein